MCHQSVGLVARALEAAGIVTTSMTSAWSITESVVTPRAVFTDFPLGNTAGPPNAPEVQLSIARSALEEVHRADTAGVIRLLAHEWDEPWKDEARELKDHRTERFDSPQYQQPSDRDAAVSAHGEAKATAPPN